MWKENKFRVNEHLVEYWGDFTWYEYNHFYHIGAKETNRHSMIEVLAIKNKGYFND
jgi:DNA adenine methylase